MKIVVALFLGLYIGLHWHVKKSVDEHVPVGENRRHHHKYFDRE